ncbi:MAG: amino acid permease [Spirochaetia bacterium]
MKKFNTFNGVFVPSFEAILGAVLFLILPMLTGGVGLPNMIIIVLLANTVTIATAFSIADCTTNLENVGPGGMYAISKRSLGKAFGGSIGIQLFLAQAASIGFYAIGFAEPLQSVLIQIPQVADIVEQYGLSIVRQKQIIATIIALIAFVAGIIGANFIVKIQMIIFIVLSVSVATIIISPFLGVTLEGHALFTPTPNMAGTGIAIGFWGAFTAFFPAVTGIDAGVGMSGSLREPKKALAKGTFIAIGVTTVVYLLVSVIFSYIRPEMLELQNGQVPSTVDLFIEIPIISFLLLTGILFATGSSALSYLMTAPRTAQALTNDNLLPKFLSFLSKDFRRNGVEPRWATLCTLLIAMPVIWSGSITVASMVVGICFLIVYGWVNLAAFFERVSGNPSFRPTSKGHWAISLYGFLVCMAVIAMFNIWVGVGVFFSQILVFYLLLRYKTNNQMEGVWWGVAFSVITWGFKRMRRIIQGTKNWRPIVTIFGFVDKKEETEQAFLMARRIADYKGLYTLNLFRPATKKQEKETVYEDANVLTVQGDEYKSAISSIVQAAMPGGFTLNTVMLSFDMRMNIPDIVEDLIRREKHVLLFKPGQQAEVVSNRIDVWWKGEDNGNLMALLSFIINESDAAAGKPRKHIRLLRKLFPGEELKKAKHELEKLLSAARLKGEVLVLEDDEYPIHETIRVYSHDASLALMGMPGKKAGNFAKMFSLDRIFFSREIAKYEEMPPLLFVKAGNKVSLLEEDEEENDEETTPAS